MICPFRIKRYVSATVSNEFADVFRLCLERDCPCYQREGDAEWCYRDARRFPLNQTARNIADEVTE